MTARTAGSGYPVRGQDNDEIHASDVGPSALVDPSGGRTFCGQPVMEVYNDGRDVTCVVCATSGGGSTG